MRADIGMRHNWKGGAEPNDPCEAFPCGLYLLYRHVSSDTAVARSVAAILPELGIRTFFDEEDACLKDAVAARDERAVAQCIEDGLDKADALLSVVSPHTFASPWPSYEIGSARGRKRFTTPRAVELARELKYPGGTIAIAHLIHESVTQPPAFLLLGSPLDSLDQLRVWARLVHELRTTTPPDPETAERRFKAAVVNSALERTVPEARVARLTFDVGDRDMPS